MWFLILVDFEFKRYEKGKEERGRENDRKIEHTIVFRKVIDKVWVHDFFFQQIFLVKEQNDGRVLEPWICDYRLEQCFTFFHSVLHLIHSRLSIHSDSDSIQIRFRRERKMQWRSLASHWVLSWERIVSLTSLSDSKRIWSYSLSATKKIIDVTFSKQWIHFRLSDLWPPTSTILWWKIRC